MTHENELVSYTNNQPVTNSLLVAQKFNKQHKHVIKTIKDLITSAEKSANLFVESEYSDSYGRMNPMYVMNRDGFSLLVMGFTGKDALNFKLEFIEAFNKMEKKIKEQQAAIPQTFSEALILAARQAEQLELQQKELKAAAPKVNYFDHVLQSNGTYTMTQVAKELDITIYVFERWLKNNRVMFRQSGQWFVYAEHQGKGYTKPRTHHYTHADGSTGTNTITTFTESGRQFIHSLFRKGGII